MSQEPARPQLSDEEWQQIRSRFDELMEAYQAGRADSEREDRYDKLLAAMTSTNVTHQLVEAIERLATTGRGPAADPKTVRAAQLYEELGVRLGRAENPDGSSPWRPWTFVTAVDDTGMPVGLRLDPGRGTQLAVTQARPLPEGKVPRTVPVDGDGVLLFANPRPADVQGLALMDRNNTIVAVARRQ
jgi:hypothetical protein